MFFRLLYQSFLRQRRRKLLAGIAIALGMTIATAMIAVGIDIGDRMNEELRAYGANIVVYPQEDTLDVQIGGVRLKPSSAGSYLHESDLPKLKHIFWGHNILGFSPMLPGSVKVNGKDAKIVGTYFAKEIAISPDDSFETGVRKTHTWWKVQGEWPKDSGEEVLVGSRLAAAQHVSVGQIIAIHGENHRISGILQTGSQDEEDAIVAPLALVQRLLGKPDQVHSVFVSALTKPEDEFARRDPRSLSPDLLEKWSCSPYANSIAFQIMQAFPGAKAEQIRKVAQNEGLLLSRISGLMILITFFALVAAMLSISAAMATSVLERRAEIGVMRSLGATNSAIAALFVLEATFLAIAAGMVGFLFGTLLARMIGNTVFGSAILVEPVLLPFILLLAIVVTLAGSGAAIGRALRFSPAAILRGDVA